jgi:hypothetical protein
MCKDAFNLPAHQTLLMIVLPILVGELDVVRFLFQDPVADGAGGNLEIVRRANSRSLF